MIDDWGEVWAVDKETLSRGMCNGDEMRFFDRRLRLQMARVFACDACDKCSKCCSC